MDERPVSYRFGPDRRLDAAFAVIAVIAGAAAVAADAEGRLLFAGGALIMAGYAVTDVLYWPRLAVSSHGLQVRTPALRAHLDWSQVNAVRIDERSRHGLSSRMLEIDAGPHLVVFSRRALGVDPQEAKDLIDALLPQSRRAPDNGDHQHHDETGQPE